MEQLIKMEKYGANSAYPYKGKEPVKESMKVEVEESLLETMEEFREELEKTKNDLKKSKKK